MVGNRVFKFAVLTASTLLVAACATQPDGALLEKKFRIAAKSYQKFQHEGQVVYCKKDKVITSAVPVMQCLSEAQLRQEVQSFERWRNPVQRPVTPGTGTGGIG